MSIHGVCFDNGMSGNCNQTCSEFLEGNCSEGANLINNCTDTEIELLLEETHTVFEAECKKALNLNIRQEVIDAYNY